MVKTLHNVFVSARGLLYSQEGALLDWPLQVAPGKTHSIWGEEWRLQELSEEARELILNKKYTTVTTPHIHMFQIRHHYAWGHFYDSFRNLHFFEEAGLKDIPLAVYPTSNHVIDMDLHLELLWNNNHTAFELFNVNTSSSNVFKFETLYLVSDKHYGCYISSKARNHLLQKYRSLFKPSKFTHLYIHRPTIPEKPNKGRPVSNESEALEYMKKRGFKILGQKTLGLKEAFPLWQNAGFIVHPHGGAGYNNLFCQQNPIILEYNCQSYGGKDVMQKNSLRWKSARHFYRNQASDRVTIDLQEVESFLLNPPPKVL